MGIFVNYSSNIFPSVTNIPTTILTANTNVIVVNSITICNLGIENIRFNLQKVRTIGTTQATISYVNQFEIQTYNTVDIVAQFGLQIYLQYSITPSISDSLVCFSNGYTQTFDCEITYTILNELPN
jgi:hypothetical protein